MSLETGTSTTDTVNEEVSTFKALLKPRLPNLNEAASWVTKWGTISVSRTQGYMESGLSGFRLKGSAFRVQGLRKGVRVQHLGLRAQRCRW